METEFASNPLTGRERQILHLAANGHTSKEIAQLIDIAHRTVERHIENARLKLGARNRAHLISKAIERGILMESENPEHESPEQLSLDLPKDRKHDGEREGEQGG